MQILVGITNFIFQPWMYFLLSVLAFWAMIRYRETWTEPKFAMKMLGGVVGVLLLSMFNDHFRDISTKADNFPIFIMVFSVGFFTWLSFRQAVVNDRRIAQGQPPVEKETSDKKTYVWPDLVYIEFIATVIGGVISPFNLVFGTSCPSGRISHTRMDAESLKGALVLPGLAGDAGLL